MKRSAMIKTILPYVALVRPWQWIKNIAVGAPILFAGKLFVPQYFWSTVIAFFSLCFLSSAHYIINDIVDVKKDRLHPFKKFRPLPQSVVSKQAAWVLWAVMTAFGFVLTIFLGSYFFTTAIAYTAIHYGLILKFRNMPIIDILALATGYVLRIAAGEAATGIRISVWLILSALCLSLLLAIGKRRFELRVAVEHSLQIPKMYSARLLDTYLSMFAAATFLSYCYFTFLTTFASDILDLTSPFGSRKWLMISIPFVLFSILRYLQALYVGKEQTYAILLGKDFFLIGASVLWFVSIFSVIYGIGR